MAFLRLRSVLDSLLLSYSCLMNDSIDFKQKRLIRISSQCEELFNQTNPRRLPVKSIQYSLSKTVSML
jgi:hypothetical protein